MSSFLFGIRSQMAKPGTIRHWEPVSEQLLVSASRGRRCGQRLPLHSSIFKGLRWSHGSENVTSDELVEMAMTCFPSAWYAIGEL